MDKYKGWTVSRFFWSRRERLYRDVVLDKEKSGITEGKLKVIKETDKAVCIKFVYKDHMKSDFMYRDVWVPKTSLIKIEDAVRDSCICQASFNRGCKEYNELVAQAKEMGVTRACKGMKKKTILELMGQKKANG